MITLQDIADQLKVTRATVSYVLSDRGTHMGISPAMQEAVRKKAEELGYRRNRLAMSLKTRATKTIGVVLTTIRGDIYGDMLHGIQAVLGRDYKILVGVSERDAANEKRVLESFEEWMVEGIILVSAGHNTNVSLLRRLQHEGVRIVQVGSAYADLNADVAEPDEEVLTHMLTKYLLDLGHRQVVFIRSPRTTAGTIARAEGYERAMRARKLQPLLFPRHPVDVETQRLEFAQSQALDALDMCKPPLGIVAHDVYEALGVMKAIEEKGLKCPTDVSVCAVRSARHSPLYDFLKVRLTLADWSIEALGQEAARLLLDRLKEKPMASTRRVKSRLPFHAKTIKIPGRLVLGESTASPR